MIGPDQLTYIEENAYLPEHLIHYVTAVSQSEPSLIRDCLVYVGEGRAILVGYPLKESFDEKEVKKALRRSRSNSRSRRSISFRRRYPGERRLRSTTISG